MVLAKIGVAGCGRMGQPMLAALINAGFDARGFDIVPSERYGELSRHISNDATGFAGDLRVLFTVVRDITQTENLLFSKQQLLDIAPELQVIVVCSTLSPRYVQSLKSRIPAHIKLVDAPMSGAAIAAKERRLSFMLGGETSVLRDLHPLFMAMGKSFHHMGSYGAGMSAKVLNNLLAASSTVMTRLVLDWAKQQGLDEGKLLELIDKSSGQNWFASEFERIEFASHGFSAENSLGILKKDVLSALDDAPQNADTKLPDLLAELIGELKPK